MSRRSHRVILMRPVLQRATSLTTPDIARTTENWNGRDLLSIPQYVKKNDVLLTSRRNDTNSISDYNKTDESELCPRVPNVDVPVTERCGNADGPGGISMQHSIIESLFSPKYRIESLKNARSLKSLAAPNDAVNHSSIGGELDKNLSFNEGEMKGFKVMIRNGNLSRRLSSSSSTSSASNDTSATSSAAEVHDDEYDEISQRKDGDLTSTHASEYPTLDGQFLQDAPSSPLKLLLTVPSLRILNGNVINLKSTSSQTTGLRRRDFVTSSHASQCIGQRNIGYVGSLSHSTARESSLKALLLGVPCSINDNFSTTSQSLARSVSNLPQNIADDQRFYLIDHTYCWSVPSDQRTISTVVRDINNRRLSSPRKSSGEYSRRSRPALKITDEIRQQRAQKRREARVSRDAAPVIRESKEKSCVRRTAKSNDRNSRRNGSSAHAIKKPQSISTGTQNRVKRGEKISQTVGSRSSSKRSVVARFRSKVTCSKERSAGAGPEHNGGAGSKCRAGAGPGPRGRAAPEHGGGAGAERRAAAGPDHRGGAGAEHMAEAGPEYRGETGSARFVRASGCLEVNKTVSGFVGRETDPRRSPGSSCRRGKEGEEEGSKRVVRLPGRYWEDFECPVAVETRRVDVAASTPRNVLRRTDIKRSPLSIQLRGSKTSPRTISRTAHRDREICNDRLTQPMLWNDVSGGKRGVYAEHHRLLRGRTIPYARQNPMIQNLTESLPCTSVVGDGSSVGGIDEDLIFSSGGLLSRAFASLVNNKLDDFDEAEFDNFKSVDSSEVEDNCEDNSSGFVSSDPVVGAVGRDWVANSDQSHLFVNPVGFSDWTQQVNGSGLVGEESEGAKDLDGAVDVGCVADKVRVVRLSSLGETELDLIESRLNERNEIESIQFTTDFDEASNSSTSEGAIEADPLPQSTHDDEQLQLEACPVVTLNNDALFTPSQASFICFADATFAVPLSQTDVPLSQISALAPLLPSAEISRSTSNASTTSTLHASLARCSPPDQSLSCSVSQQNDRRKAHSLALTPEALSMTSMPCHDTVTDSMTLYPSLLTPTSLNLSETEWPTVVTSLSNESMFSDIVKMEAEGDVDQLRSINIEDWCAGGEENASFSSLLSSPSNTTVLSMLEQNCHTSLTLDDILESISRSTLSAKQNMFDFVVNTDTPTLDESERCSPKSNLIKNKGDNIEWHDSIQDYDLEHKSNSDEMMLKEKVNSENLTIKSTRTPRKSRHMSREEVVRTISTRSFIAHEPSVHDTSIDGTSSSRKQSPRLRATVTRRTVELQISGYKSKRKT